MRSQRGGAGIAAGGTARASADLGRVDAARLLRSKYRFLHECDLIDILIYLAIKIDSNPDFLIYEGFLF